MVAPVTFAVLTRHWYIGAVPPFVGVAVNVTWEPAQNGLFADAVIETLTGNNGFTTIVTVFEVAGFPVVQIILDVKPQVIALPFSGLNVYVEFVAPCAFVPFTFH